MNPVDQGFLRHAVDLALEAERRDELDRTRLAGGLRSSQSEGAGAVLVTFRLNLAFGFPPPAAVERLLGLIVNPTLNQPQAIRRDLTGGNMNRIDLQSKTRAEPGEFSCYWFENESVGLARTKFCRFEIPLEPFDSGLDYEEQPVTTDLVIEWLPLDVASTQELDGWVVSSESHPSLEGSIYLGAAHNWCDVKSLQMKRINDDEVEVIGEIVVELQNEGIAPNESFSFATRVFCDFSPASEDEYWNMTLPDD